MSCSVMLISFLYGESMSSRISNCSILGGQEFKYIFEGGKNWLEGCLLTGEINKFPTEKNEKQMKKKNLSKGYLTWYFNL